MGKNDVKSTHADLNQLAGRVTNAAKEALNLFSESWQVFLCMKHQEWDVVPANLLTQARWFEDVANTATNWVLPRLL